MIAARDLQTTAEQLTAHISALFVPDDIVEFRLIREGESKSSWHRAGDIIEQAEQFADALAEDNADGWNVYIGANPRPHKGAKSDASIRIARTVFVDFDDDAIVESVQAAIDALPAPSLMLASGHGIHVYWRLTEECGNLAAWSGLQQDLAAHLGSDQTIFNPERVMRVPGFTNYKKNKLPVPATLIDCYADRTSDFAEIRELVPPRPVDAPKNPPRPPCSDRPVDDAMKMKRCLAYVGKCPPSVDGEHGSNAMLRVAAECIRFDLTDSDAMAVMRHYSAAQATPPWSEKELEHKLESAHKHADKERGSRLTEDRPDWKKHNGNGKSNGKVDSSPAPDVGDEDRPIGPSWPDPVPLSDPEPPPLPDGMFAGWLGDIISATAAATETPVELAASLGLAAIATTVQGRVSVCIEPGYFEALAFYVACFLLSGQRKSAVLQRFLSPFIEWERIKAAEVEPEIKRLTSERKTREGQIRAMREKASKLNGAEAEAAVKEIAENEADLTEIPELPRAVAQDITPEHLATMLSKHDERMSIWSDESGIFDLLSGRYSTNGMANLDLVLQAYSGSPVRVDRGSRPPVRLNHPTLTIAVTPQPEVADGLASRPGFRGRGLLARFLYIMPKSNLGSRTLEPRPVPDEVSRRYREYIIELLNVKPPAEVGRDGPYVLMLDADAYRIWKDFQRGIEKLMLPGQRLAELTDIGGKMPGACARIAGLLHMADYGARGIDSRHISADVMTRAVTLTSFYLEHGLYVLGTMGADGALQTARRLWAEVVKLGKASVSARELWTGTRSVYPKMADAEPGFKVLIERGYLIPPDDEDRHGAGRPSRRFTVNPKALNGSAHFARGSGVEGGAV